MVSRTIRGVMVMFRYRCRIGMPECRSISGAQPFQSEFDYQVGRWEPNHGCAVVHSSNCMHIGF